MTLDASSRTLSPLPEVLSRGLVPVSTFALLSFFCSCSLLFYLTWRLISWRFLNGKGNTPNQFLLLIYNLLLADIQQAIAFLLNISALRNNGIMVGTTTCFAQGWFVSTGDLASSVFICAIAVHTWLGIVKEYRLPTLVFYCCIAFCWFFIYLMAALGPLIHGKEFYVRASAWCWISDAFEIERLWLHYFWLFAAMFLTISIYAYIFIFLHQRSKRHSNASALSSKASRIFHGASPLMILYPLIYSICTAPLAAGRLVALGGHEVSLGYFCFAGTMIACNGWLDVLLYASTRADIVFSEFPPGEDVGIETFAFMGKDRNLGTITTIEAGINTSRTQSRNGSRLGMRSSRRSNGSDSAEHLYGLGLGDISVKEAVIVSVDDAPPPDTADTMQTWDTMSVRSGKSGKSAKSGKSMRSLRSFKL